MSEQLIVPKEILKKLDSSKFLFRCRQKQVSVEELKTFLVQHFHYSRHFTRYLCALMANLPNEVDRYELSENLFEEMGLGDLGEIPHSQIYRNMLQDLGIDPFASPILPETRELIDSMLQLCSNEDSMIGLGALYLGAEAIVPHFYRQILSAFLALGFPEKKLLFFTLHIVGDEDHALTMQKIVDREIQENPRNQQTLMDSANLIIGKRVKFLDAMLDFSVQKNYTEVSSAV